MKSFSHMAGFEFATRIDADGSMVIYEKTEKPEGPSWEIRLDNHTGNDTWTVFAKIPYFECNKFVGLKTFYNIMEALDMCKTF